MRETDVIEPISSFERTVNGEGLAQVLHCLEMAGGSGLLAVQGEEDLVSLTLRKGDVCAADAMNHSMEDGLGEVLAQQGVLAPADYRGLMESSDSAGEFDLCSEALIATGRVERHVVLEAVRSQILRQCLGLLRWKECSLQWVLGAESPYQQGVVPLSVSEILLQSIELLGDSGPISGVGFDYRGRLLLEQDAERRIRQRAADDDLVAEETSSGVLLGSPVEMELLEKLRRKVSVSDLLSAGTRQGWRVRYGLYRLAAHGLVRPDYGGEGARPAAPGERVAASEPLLTFGETDDDLASLLGSDEGPATPIPGRTAHDATRGQDSVLGSASVFDEPLERVNVPLASDPDGILSRESSPVDEDPALHGADWGREEVDAAPRQDSAHLIATLSSWAAKALALVAVLMFVRSLPIGLAMNSVSTAVPGLSGGLAAEAAQARWSIQARSIAGALEVYHLVHGAFPGDFQVLADVDLLSPGNLQNHRGRRLSFELEGNGFRIDPVRPDEPGPLLEPVSGTIVGNFLLNPRYVESTPWVGPPPVEVVRRE